MQLPLRDMLCMILCSVRYLGILRAGNASFGPSAESGVLLSAASCSNRPVFLLAVLGLDTGI